MSLALDADDKISGIYFKRRAKPPVDMQSFVLRFFSCRSALARAFLSGRVVVFVVVAEANQRAVGISTLGIHLHKDQNLLLWDEIKRSSAT